VMAQRKGLQHPFFVFCAIEGELPFDATFPLLTFPLFPASVPLRFNCAFIYNALSFNRLLILLSVMFPFLLSLSLPCSGWSFAIRPLAASTYNIVFLRVFSLSCCPLLSHFRVQCGYVLSAPVLVRVQHSSLPYIHLLHDSSFRCSIIHSSA
jgi:hypothetical protein